MMVSIYGVFVVGAALAQNNLDREWVVRIPLESDVPAAKSIVLLGMLTACASFHFILLFHNHLSYKLLRQLVDRGLIYFR